MRFSVLFSLLLWSTAWGQSLVHERILANGFTVLVVENHEQPTAFGAVVIKAGGKHDPADATGMAHYLEHMLFKGTTTLGTLSYEKEKVWLDSISHYYDLLGKTTLEEERQKIQLKINALSIKAGEYALANEMDKMLAEIGGTGVNAYTTVESTVYHNSFPSNELEKWMDIYSHRFEHPVFRLFQSELETVYEEKNRKMDDLGSSIFEYYLTHFFKHHPYGQQTIIGKTEHLKNPSLTKMYDYFNTYYVANNMALVIAGDVNAEEVFALAEKKFGAWQKKTLPAFGPYNEESFKGKEIIRIRRTPVKAGVLGYRIPKNTDPDIPALNIISGLLSNSASSGSIDRLVSNNKIFMGGLEYMPYNDGGAAFLYFVPKILVQRLGKAEKRVLACVKDIQNGNFSDEDFSAVKNYQVKQLKLSLENNASVANNVIQDFIKNVPSGSFLQRIEQLQTISKEDIQGVAKKYFGQNALAMYSRMGFPKKDKLKKPPFKPVIAKNKGESEFYQSWKKIKSDTLLPRFIEPKKEIDSIGINQNFYVLKNKNPFNNIATMNLIFGTGKHYDKTLEYADNYLMLCGTKTLPINDFNQKIYALGCTFDVDVSNHQLIVRLSFPEENLNQVVELITQLLNNPAQNKHVIRKIHKTIRGEKLMNMRSTEYWSDALNAYAVYGENSPYLDKLPFRNIKRKGDTHIPEAIQQLKKASLKIYYTGNVATTDLVHVLNANGLNVAREEPKALYTPEKIEPTQNMVYMLNARKARQTQIDIYKITNAYTLEQAPLVNAFNKYFGGDMSSIMFQEIREFRSLAYATSGGYAIPASTGKKGLFNAYAGTQNDKTNECIEVMYDLVNNIPFYPDRLPSIKSSLIEIASASRPSFRNMISQVEGWKRRGYAYDPAKYNLEAYKKLTFDDMTTFYKENIQEKKTILCLTGKLRAIDTKKLTQYGKIIRMKKRKLVRN